MAGEDVSIKVSRKGFNAGTCSDKQLAMSSEWNLLPLEAEGVFEVNNTLTAPVTIYTHNLGYVAPFRIYHQSDFESGSLFDSSLTYHGGGQRPGITCYMTSTALVWDSAYSSETPLYIHWKIYRRNLELNQTTEDFSLVDETQGPYDDHGLLVSKKGKSVNSTDMRDFTFRSDLRPLIVDGSVYTTTPSYSISYTHNLGYRPMYWAFTEYTPDSGRWSRVTQGEFFRGEVTTTSLDFEVSSSLWDDKSNFALIIFKSTINTND